MSFQNLLKLSSYFKGRAVTSPRDSFSKKSVASLGISCGLADDEDADGCEEDKRDGDTNEVMFCLYLVERESERMTNDGLGLGFGLLLSVSLPLSLSRSGSLSLSLLDDVE